MKQSDYEDRVDKVLVTVDAIPQDGSVCILTGRNGSGKSLLRKQMNFRLPEGARVIHTSMDLRTGSHAHMGGLAGMVRDMDWIATSNNTFGSINTAINTVSETKNYLFLDEIEIGCGLEVVAGLVDWLNENLRKRIKGTLGCTIITHSPYVVENLDFDHWFNLDGYETPDEWINREVIPVDMEAWKEDQLEFFKVVRDRQKKKD